MGLGAAVANHVGKIGLCQALNSRGEVVVGQEMVGSPLEIGSKARARDQVQSTQHGDSKGEREALLSRV